MKIRNLIFSTFMVFTFLVTSCSTKENEGDGASNKDPIRKTIDIYGVNDFHGAFTYDKDSKQTGLGRIGNYLINQKNENPDSTFIVSQGDMWQGGVESNKTKGKLVTEAMNLIGFDAMAIGNHEFDWGEEAIKANKEIMNFSLLNSNIFYSKDNSRPNYLTPSINVERGGVKIGFIGAASSSLGNDIIGSISKKFTFNDPINYIKEESDKLKKDGCDAIILLTHDGGENESEFKYKELTIGESPYIDAIFLGHDHRQKSGSSNGVPYIEGGSNGRYISHIQLEIVRSTKETSVKSKKSENIFTFETSGFKKTNQEIENLLDKYKNDIGDIDRVIYNFQGNYSKSEFLNIVCRAMFEYINDKKSDYPYEIIGSFHNSGGIRAAVHAGEFTYRDLIKVCPFTNTIVIMKVNETVYNQLFNNGNYIDSKPTFENGFAYVAAISFVSENEFYENVEKHDTGFIIQDVIEYFLGKHPNEF